MNIMLKIIIVALLLWVAWEMRETNLINRAVMVRMQERLNVMESEMNDVHQESRTAAICAANALDQVEDRLVGRIKYKRQNPKEPSFE